MDCASYPHIFEAIINAATAPGTSHDPPADAEPAGPRSATGIEHIKGALVLRATSRALRDKIDSILFDHVALDFSVVLFTGNRRSRLPCGRGWPAQFGYISVLDIYTPVGIGLDRNVPLDRLHTVRVHACACVVCHRYIAPESPRAVHTLLYRLVAAEDCRMNVQVTVRVRRLVFLIALAKPPDDEGFDRKIISCNIRTALLDAVFLFAGPSLPQGRVLGGVLREASAAALRGTRITFVANREIVEGQDLLREYARLPRPRVPRPENVKVLTWDQWRAEASPLEREWLDPRVAGQRAHQGEIYCDGLEALKRGPWE